MNVLNPVPLIDLTPPSDTDQLADVKFYYEELKTEKNIVTLSDPIA